MDMSRKTYMEIDLKSIETNVKKIINKFNNYKYYFGVVKADAYGYGDINSAEAIIKGGCNYLAVATYEEALEIRNKIADIPILCLGVINPKFINDCIKNNITITINSVDYLKEIMKEIHKGLKVHIKINTGMNRLGISCREELKEVYDITNKENINVEGIYTHIYNASSKEDYTKQIQKFENIIDVIDISNIKIVHISASEALVKYYKPDFVNGCRLGIIMYGFTEDKELNLSSAIKLYSEVVQINELRKGDTVRI